MLFNSSSNKAKELWGRCLDFIRDNVEETAFHTWFEPIVPYNYKEDESALYLQVPSAFFCEFLEEHYMAVIQAALKKVIGPRTSLFYNACIDSGLSEGVTMQSDPVTKPTVAPTGRKANETPVLTQNTETALPDIDPHLKPGYNFDNFIEGSSNRLPRSVGESVANEPAKTFNPLFLWGPSGCGKTHLLNAIGARTKELHPRMRVLYLSAHLFMVQYTDSVRKNCQNDFFHFYQGIDTLILDDVQEFAGVKATQNTFFHIFNHLYLNGKQIILAADRAPVELQGFEERLLTRFKAGAQVEIEKPTIDLRRAILQKKITHDGLSIPADVVNYLAENVSESVREFEGILCSLNAHAICMKRPIDRNLAETIVKKSIRISQRKIPLDDIVRHVCDFFSVKPEDLNSRSRKRDIATARQIAMYLAKKHTEESTARIGRVIGQRDHATVIHACKTVKNQCEVDKTFQTTVDEVEQALRQPEA